MMYAIDPVTDADRAIDAEEFERLEAELQSKLRARKAKQFKAAMLEALKEDHNALLPVECGKKRKAISIAFCDATDETHNLIMNMVRDGASGQDVQLRCALLLENFAASYAEYADISTVFAS